MEIPFSVFIGIDMMFVLACGIFIGLRIERQKHNRIVSQLLFERIKGADPVASVTRAGAISGIPSPNLGGGNGSYHIHGGNGGNGGRYIYGGIECRCPACSSSNIPIPKKSPPPIKPARWQV